MLLSLRFGPWLTIAGLLLSSQALAQGQPAGGPGATSGSPGPAVSPPQNPGGTPGTNDQNPLLLPAREGRASGPSERTLKLSLAPEVLLGGTRRMNDLPSGNAIDERYSINYQAGLYLGIGPWVDVGAYWQHTGLGTESPTGYGNLTAIDSRLSLNAAMLEVRLNPIRYDWARLFLGITGGLAWQSVDYRATPIANPAEAGGQTLVKCGATDGPSLGLGASVGGDFDVGAGWEFLLRATGSVYRFSSDTLKNDGNPCATGAGSSTLLQAQLGFRYRFDLGEGTMDDKGEKHTAGAPK